MTNRTKLGTEMLEMPIPEFRKLLEEGPLFDRVNDIMCKQCEKEHGGCPAGDDADCVKDLDEWLAEECKVERILPRKEEERQ